MSTVRKQRAVDAGSQLSEMTLPTVKVAPPTSPSLIWAISQACPEACLLGGFRSIKLSHCKMVPLAAVWRSAMAGREGGEGQKQNRKVDKWAVMVACDGHWPVLRA